MLSGTIMPPPSPCRTRNAMRLPADQAVAHNVEPIRKIVSALSHTVRLPYLSTSRPVVGMVIAIASRYAVPREQTSSRRMSCTPAS